MTALVVVPAVEIQHRGPNIGHGLPVLTEGELIFIGPVEALQDSRAPGWETLQRTQLPYFKQPW